MNGVKCIEIGNFMICYGKSGRNGESTLAVGIGKHECCFNERTEFCLCFVLWFWFINIGFFKGEKGVHSR